jgi:hypothetical protein
MIVKAVSEISFADFIFINRIACGKSEIVVNAAPIIPTHVKSFIK